ncbi:phosphoribosyltransferase [Streptomyces cocklensis]|jgi:predicted phosphoribosyltransferase|uniref:Phosphoribosyltransferase n=1 Tax=Actinacidiphila cocklensis TaxID=887465 RepID=A0A9W4E432_9ACTN|nr:phosphoribosyltransferase family protein [Actinacidiphila cocklensis]MDD1063340.1 phosphoribosyltransferase [Actinacidiphila cocklensis]WSX74899.1 phosphoribosyltransferase family protein [Streptomyces sp. NBC_00899]CAG6399052.1 Phosphoribosyltransferase [Actinacidiphila cocklensis]
MQFHDRSQAGQQLAEQMRYRQERGALPDPVVLALPRGGVPVAREVARVLEAPLDVLVVRKIGAPFQEEFGIGAITGDGEPLFDEDALDRLGLSHADLAGTVERERAELHRREELYRQGRPAPDLRGHTVIVVDDGLATGVTARAAVRAVRRQAPSEQIVLAVPVCSPQASALLRAEADEVICLHCPTSFTAVGLWYDRFDQLSDQDVLAVLHTGAGR